MQHSQSAGPTHSRAGKRAWQERASPGKGQTHWKSWLVSVPVETGASLHGYQRSFRERAHGGVRTDGPAELGEPGDRDPPTDPATGQEARALSHVSAGLPGHTRTDARVSSEAHSMPAAQLCFQCPAPGTAVILGSIKATPKILSAPLLWLALSAFRHTTSRLA